MPIVWIVVVFVTFVIVPPVPVTVRIVISFVTPAMLVDDHHVIVIMVMVVDTTNHSRPSQQNNWHPPMPQSERGHILQ
jgi:hypothetical protein